VPFELRDAALAAVTEAVAALPGSRLLDWRWTLLAWDDGIANALALERGIGSSGGKSAGGLDGARLHAGAARLADRALEHAVVLPVAAFGHLNDHEAFAAVGDARLVAKLGWLARVAAPDRPRSRIDERNAPVGDRRLPGQALCGLREHLRG